MRKGTHHTLESRRKNSESSMGKHIGALESRFGKEKADKIKNKYGERTRNKTYEEIYGIKKAARFRKKLSILRIGKTWADRCGVEKAKQMRIIARQRRLERKAKLGYINSPETRKKLSVPKGTLEERFGKIKANKRKKVLSLAHAGIPSIYKNKTYEERYGEEKAKEIKEKLRIFNTGNIISDKTRRKMRLKTIDYIRRVCKGIRPNLGHNEEKILDKLEKELGYKILRQYEVKAVGCFLDGYIPELNLAIEVDEKHHNYTKHIKKDIIKQIETERELNCKFIRIKDND